MAKIFKISGYLIDPFGECIGGDIGATLYTELGLTSQHLHIEKAIVTDIVDEHLFEHPLMVDNVDLAICEKYFKAEPTVPSDRPLPQAGELYKHFKVGKLVEVVGVSQDTENVGSYSVVHICKGKDNNGKLWHRPLDMFLSKVDAEKYPEHKGKWRFEKVVI